MILRKAFPNAKHFQFPKLSRHNPCNPSIISTANGYVATVRGVNYDISGGNYYFRYGSQSTRLPDTQNYFAILDNEFNLISYQFIEDRHIRAEPWALDGVEDMRLFEWQDKLYVLATALNKTEGRFQMMMGQLIDHYLVNPVPMLSPYQEPIEKNWAPRVHHNELEFLYYPSNNEVFEFQNGELIPIAFGPVHEQLASFSGSSQIVKQGESFYGVVHRRYGMKFYEHKLVEYDEHWNIKRVSQEFMFEAPQIEFCSGLAFKDNKITFSYGVMDKNAVLLQLNFSELEKLIFKDSP